MLPGESKYSLPGNLLSKSARGRRSRRQRAAWGINESTLCQMLTKNVLLVELALARYYGHVCCFVLNDVVKLVGEATMIENFRRFEAGPDPEGRKWVVEFRWLQNAITIRHADAVDVKFFLKSGEEVREIVVALPHGLLRELSQELNRPLTDPWCMKLAALHVKQMIETGTELEKRLVTLNKEQLRKYNQELEQIEQQLLAKVRS